MSAPSYLSVGSLFSGVGGFDLGLERAGFHVVFQAEQDEFRRRVLTKRFPCRRVFSDVHDVGRDAGHVGVLCGGFPCQDLSVAGRRAGLAGKRSGLFFEFMRIADDLVLPGGFVLIENVPGLLSSHGGRDFAVVLASLAELGFHDCAWRVLDSRYFGVPQRRRRVYILARRARGGVCSEVLLEPEGVRGHPETSWEARARAARAPGGGAEDSRVAATLSRGSAGPGVSVPGRRQEDDENVVVNALGTGSISRYDDNTAQGNQLIPETAATLITNAQGLRTTDLDGGTYIPVFAPAIVQRYGKGTDSDATDTLIVGGDPESVRHAHTLTSEGFDASEDGTGRGTPLIVADGGVGEPARGAARDGVQPADHDGRRQAGAGVRDGAGGGSGAPADTDGVRASAELPGRLDDDPVGDITSFHAYAGNRVAGEVKTNETNPITVKQGPPSILCPAAYDDRNATVDEDAHHTLRAAGGQRSSDALYLPPAEVSHETGRGWWKTDDVAGTLRAEGENRPSRPGHVVNRGVEAYALRGREDGVEVERTDLPNLRGHTGKDGGGHDGFVHVEPRVMDASSTHGHEGVGTGMPNMSAPGESLALTTRADRYTVFGDLPEDLRVVPYDPAPDGRRYAAMGDAVTVNTIEWIAVRLRAAIEKAAADG